MSNIPHHDCAVFPGGAIGVVSGAGQGRTLGPVSEAHPGDLYQLAPQAQALLLRLTLDGESPRVAQGSAVGTPGTTALRRGRYLFMDATGADVELELLEIEGLLFALPLAPMLTRTDYTLLRADAGDSSFRLSDLACASFLAGTRIALACGGQCPVEMLEPGAAVLTRDHGSQPLRWIGQVAKRAHGQFAPVRFAPGVLGNAGALQVSPHHRVFLYQRGDRRLAGRAELLVQARYLVDGQAVTQRTGGMVTYFSLVFDHHEIVYAEGIPVESLAVSEATMAQLPPLLADDMRNRFPGLRHRLHFAAEPASPDPDAGASELRARFLHRGNTPPMRAAVAAEPTTKKGAPEGAPRSGLPWRRS